MPRLNRRPWESPCADVTIAAHAYAWEPLCYPCAFEKFLRFSYLQDKHNASYFSEMSGTGRARSDCKFTDSMRYYKGFGEEFHFDIAWIQWLFIRTVHQKTFPRTARTAPKVGTTNENDRLKPYIKRSRFTASVNLLLYPNQGLAAKCCVAYIYIYKLGAEFWNFRA